MSYDTEAAFNYLKTREDISKIGLCGHSEGVTIAFMVAARNPKIDFIISMAGTAISGADILLSQQRAIGKANNISTPMLDNIVKTNKKHFDIILNSKANDKVLRQEILSRASSDKSMTQSSINKVISTLTEPWIDVLFYKI